MTNRKDKLTFNVEDFQTEIFRSGIGEPQSVRVVHLPTRMVEQQNHKSQLEAKELCFSRLRIRIALEQIRTGVMVEEGYEWTLCARYYVLTKETNTAGMAYVDERIKHLSLNEEIFIEECREEQIIPSRERYEEQTSGQ